MKKITKYWFTMIEILIWVLIMSIVVMAWFQAFSSILIWKIKLVQKTDLEKQAYYFSEKLFEEIKKWWTIDYEEYFNRKIIWNSSFTGGHFDVDSWFWNFWSGWITWTITYGEHDLYCISWTGAWEEMTNTWCIIWNNINKSKFWWVIPLAINRDYSWDHLVFGVYANQFVDYNSNANDDMWDEDWDGDIRWDEDDKYLWDGPIAFSWWTNLRELYLISWDWKKRTFFRWSISQDPEAPSWYTCNATWALSWTGCIWNIEILKLRWFDIWTNHNYNILWSWQSDWLIDTWMIDESYDASFSWFDISSDTLWYTVAWSNLWYYWQSLFPSDISVNKFEVYLYPNKNIDYAWKDFSAETNISPYLKINITIGPSWKLKKVLKWNYEEIDISTTINLTEILSNY